MRKNTSIEDLSNVSSLNDPLKQLDPNSETVRAKQELIRQKTQEYFASKGWPDSEHLIDETVAQFNKQLLKLSTSHINDQLLVLTATARRVLKKHLKYWAKTPEAFNRLMAWLDANESKAADKYQYIHFKLTKLFIAYGAANAEDLADETILRVIKRLPEIQSTYQGHPDLYFSGVAKKIHKEYLRFAQKHENSFDEYRSKGRTPSVSQPTLSSDDPGRKCLEGCLTALDLRDREIILSYYEEDTYRRIEQRKDLAQKLGMTAGNLRVRKHRIMQKIEQCVKKCLGQPNSANTRITVDSGVE